MELTKKLRKALQKNTAAYAKLALYTCDLYRHQKTIRQTKNLG